MARSGTQPRRRRRERELRSAPWRPGRAGGSERGADCRPRRGSRRCAARAGRGARTEGFPRCCVRASGASPNMGCSLCSLQKREEHYRLLYEVRQVSVRPPEPASPRAPGGAELGSGLCAFWLLRGSPLHLSHPPRPSHAVALGCLCLNIKTGGKQT